MCPAKNETVFLIFNYNFKKKRHEGKVKSTMLWKNKETSLQCKMVLQDYNELQVIFEEMCNHTSSYLLEC